MTSPSQDIKLTMGLSHVGLAVSQLEDSVRFFEVLGFNKIGGDDKYPSVFLSDGNIMITLWQTDANATPFNRRQNVGLHHLALRVPTLAALEAAYQAANGVDGVRVDGEGAFAPQKLPNSPLTHAMLYEPSGNRIELTFHES